MMHAIAVYCASACKAGSNRYVLNTAIKNDYVIKLYTPTPVWFYCIMLDVYILKLIVTIYLLSLTSGDPHSSEQQAIGAASSDMMIAEIIKRNETELKALKLACKEKCDMLEVELEEANKQKKELLIAAYSEKKIKAEKEELESELEAMPREKLEYEEKYNKLEVELKETGKRSFHKSEKLEKGENIHHLLLLCLFQHLNCACTYG